MKFAFLLTALFLAGCVTPRSPSPSVWALESQCQSAGEFSQINACTKELLNVYYDHVWTTAPQVTQFLAFIDMTASRVAANRMTDEEGKYAIAEYAANASGQIAQARADTDLAQQQIWANAAATLIESSRPAPPPQVVVVTTQPAYRPLSPVWQPTPSSLPMQTIRAPINCMTTGASVLYTTCQ